ncbi:hypothetical protein JHK87_024678 [Glycine soja]|nr:hypothetical protein JHK87_024678 [Glycine soja]
MLHLKFVCFPLSCLQSWKEDDDEDGPSPSQGPSWFRKQYSPKGSGRHIVFIIFSLLLLVKRRLWLYKETMSFAKMILTLKPFSAVFGGNRSYYWSFINEENPQWRSGGFSNHEKSWIVHIQIENEYNGYNGTLTEPESDCSHSDLISDRLALGLGASGPLKLEDVKNVAWAIAQGSRALKPPMALKWHPDRHHGSFKVIAEEKLKHCSAAYRPLSDKLALD